MYIKEHVSFSAVEFPVKPPLILNSIYLLTTMLGWSGIGDLYKNVQNSLVRDRPIFCMDL